MNPPDADAWVVDDPIPCAICGREACEDHLPADDDPPNDGTPPNGSARRSAAADRLVHALDAERLRREVRRRVDAEERPPLIVPIMETLRARVARPVAAEAWRIAGWHPANGRVVLAAQFKAGKTTVRDNYIRSLVDGDPFLGCAATTPIRGALVLVDVEMSERTLDRWLRDQHIQADDRVVPISLRGKVASFNLLDAAVRAQWVAAFRSVGADHFVLDCLRPVLDALGLDEQREAGRFLVALDALLSEAAIPEALVVHHMGHGNERSRGDSRLRDWPDVEWRLVRRDDDPSSPRYVSAYGRDVEVPEGRLLYDPDTRRLTLQGGSRRDEQTRAALLAVSDALVGQSAGLSGRAIKEALEDSEHSRDRIDAALRFGVRTGALIKADGPKNAKLYRVSVRVSGSVRTPFPDTES